MDNKVYAKLDDAQWQEFLKKTKDKINTKTLSKVAKPIVFKDIMAHFKNEQGPEGKWEKWSDSYLTKLLTSKNATRKKHGASGKILQDSGFLRNSFLATNYRTTPENITWYNNAKTSGGFPYAYAHDNDEEARTKLPRRSFMWLSNSALETLVNSYMKAIEE